ncbi:RRQRL motif-containing zinc-binding protein [Nocardia beijingensis]
MTKGDSSTEGGDIPEYPWMLAPAHFRTRRQLRAAGLGPNRQGVAALMVGTRRGRRLVAHLFDVRKAAPKRVPSPAQLAAITKATAEHQIKAAERHGISRAELHAEVDPGPGWADSTQEGTPMSDNPSVELAGISAEVRALHAAGQLDDGVADYIDDVLADAGDQLQLGVPAGHGQRVTYLLATVAANQAREQAARLDAAVGRVDRGDEADWELEPRIRELMSQAETRLEAIPWQNRAAMVTSLVDAMVWSHDSELAAQRLDELTNSYALGWGVVIDPMEFTVSIDPDFEAEHFQRYAEAASVWDRESAAIDIVTALPMPEAAKDAATRAVMAWRGPEVDPLDPDEHRLSQMARREQLDVDLAAAPLTAEDRARVAFVVDYVRGETSRVDLLTSPVVVDPGEEARGRVAALLALFANNPKSAREVGKQITVLTAADQERVRDVGRAIQAGQPVDFAVWPGYIDRDQLTEELQLYAMDAEELRAEADYIAEADISEESPERIGISDEIAARITRMATQREQLLDQARHGKGLTSMERAQLVCTIEDIDAGVIRGHKELPELLFADERSKASVDFLRTAAPASELSTATRHEITELINATGAVTPRSREDERLRLEVSSISDSVFSVAAGSPATSVELDRQQYMIRRTELGKALARAGVNPEVRQRIRTLVDDRARQAGELGRPAAARRQQWRDKSAAAVAARDDAIAQRQAAAAGREPNPGTRACTTRPDRTAGQGQSRPTPAVGGRRQLHREEIGR